MDDSAGTPDGDPQLCAPRHQSALQIHAVEVPEGSAVTLRHDPAEVIFLCEDPRSVVAVDGERSGLRGERAEVFVDAPFL